MNLLLIAQGSDLQNSVFERYGLAGLVMVVLAGVVVTLWRRESKAHDAALQREREISQRERERGDRFEAEVRRLNELMQEKVVPVLSEATRSIGDALNFRRRGDS